MKTPAEHMAAQYEAVGRTIEARKVRQGRFSARELIMLRAISAAATEALATRIKPGKRT